MDETGAVQTSWRLEIPWPPDVATVDLLSRWQLTAKRGRQGLYVLEAPGPLLDLLDLCGLRAQLVEGPAIRGR